MFPPDDETGKNKLADDGPAPPPPPSPAEMASQMARDWWNGLAGIPPGQIMQMLKMMGQQGNGAPAAPMPPPPMMGPQG